MELFAIRPSGGSTNCSVRRWWRRSR